MKQFLLFLLVMVFLSSALFAQKDTVYVQGYYETGGTYGTLNDAIETAKTNGTISNTVFKLTPFEMYVLTSKIYLDHGQNLEIVAPQPLRAGDGTPEEVQDSAPPQIVWTEEGIDKKYIIQGYGDVVMKNVWVRWADILGNQTGSCIAFENQQEANDPEEGYFEGCVLEYAPCPPDESSGNITVKGDHFVGNFHNCYFRNNIDTHLRYYGRAVSFPYNSSGWHCDHILFENCTFANIGRLVMQEGNEYSDNVIINHCTILNTIEWVFQSAGWIRNAAITNSIFVNPYMYSYRAIDVCDDDQDFDDFLDGLCDPPGGGLINGITEVDSFNFTPDWTDYDRKIFIGNNVYLYQDWMLEWYTECGWCQERHTAREDELMHHPAPMLGENEIAFIDSTDAEGNKVFKTINVDWETIYLDDDPDFIVPATNLDTLKIFIEYKWGIAADIDWSYQPLAGFRQDWPLPENMAYNNAEYQTAAMGGFPLGDLNWYPDKLADWETQRDDEWTTINNWLDYGNPAGAIREIPGATPVEFVLKQNYPNPFNSSTKIEYSIPVSGHVSLKVFNTIGQEVATLYNGDQKAGNYLAILNANNLASGVYIYKLQADGVSISKKFTLIK